MAYLIVANIPEDFRTPELRNYFSSFIEDGSFVCFHFRHRPIEQFCEVLDQCIANKDESASTTPDLPDPILKEGPSSDADSPTTVKDLSDLSKLTSIIAQSKAKALKKQNQYKLKMNRYNEHDVAEASNTDAKSELLQLLRCTKGTCCIIKIKKSLQENFLNTYHAKHWVDRKGNITSEKCMVMYQFL